MAARASVKMAARASVKMAAGASVKVAAGASCQKAVLRGIPPPAVSMLALARLFSCPLARDGGYMRRAMAAPEKQLSPPMKLKKINDVDF